MEAMLYGLTTRSIRSLAYQIAVRNNIVHHFNNETKLVGWHWLHSFLKRNNLSLRSPEATSAARAQVFNREAVGSFFDILKSLQEKHNFPPSRIFNVDETGITANNSSSKGKKQESNVTKVRVSRTQSSSSESDVDVECLFCGNNYSKNHCGERWIMCCRCGKWAHDECAGVKSDDDDEFTCDICLQK
jgi:hypothetical protein